VRPPARTAFRYSIIAAIDRVVLELRELLGDLLDRLVQLALDVGVRRSVGEPRPSSCSRDDRVPEPTQEAVRALDALVPVVAALLERAPGTSGTAERVGAELLDDRVGHDHVPLALRHLGALADDQAVGAEACEGLLEVQPPQVVEHHGEEARVEEMEHGVLVAPDVAVHREPLRVISGSNAGRRSPSTGSAGSTSRCPGRCPRRPSRGAPSPPHSGHSVTRTTPPRVRGGSRPSRRA
jgi:hypothetical protein